MEDLVLLELPTGLSRVLVKGEGFQLAQPAWVQGCASMAGRMTITNSVYSNQGGFASLCGWKSNQVTPFR